MKALKVLLMVLALVFAAGASFVYFGLFNVAADDPHWRLTLWVMEATRERSISVRARSVGAPPALNDPQLIAAGAQEYAEMCTGCHLAPGMKETELRAGLYPKPPNLAEHAQHRKPAEAFWVVKHGMKMSGMPAWGVTHDDQRIWSMVAFLQKLPELSQSQYEALIKEEGGAGHSHGDEPAGHSHEGAAMEPQSQSESHGQDGEDSEHTHSDAHGPGDVASAPLIRATSTQAAEPTAVVDHFFNALRAGNVKAASALLDPAVLIFESGSAERSRAEYAAHHMGNDAKFLKVVTHRLQRRTSDATADLGWVASEVTFSGTVNGKRVNVVSTETMVLRRSAGQWRIVHIHWSNHPGATGA